MPVHSVSSFYVFYFYFNLRVVYPQFINKFSGFKLFAYSVLTGLSTNCS